jgi:PilZ domain-containing protein
MAQAANPAVVLPLNQERRRHQRVKVQLNGRFMLLDRREFDCQTINMSPGGALLSAATLPHIGDPVVAYIDHVGRLEGRCVRHLPDNSFAMTVTGTIRRREKLADQLTWFANRAKLGLPEDRRHERFPLKDPRSTLTLPNGSTVQCRVIDVSLSGAAVSAEVTPPLGSPVTIGRTQARVVRHIDGGFAVEFSRVQTPELLERELSPET